MYEPIGYADFFLRIGLAIILGGAIGLEREKHGRAAGFRTNILVCMGATMVMMCSQQIYALFQHLQGMAVVARVDPGRIANGIIMGIGFLGAGTIVRHETVTRGLTTAACLWFVTGVGIALGLGLYLWAVAGTALALFILMPVKRLERWLEVDRYSVATVTGDARLLNYAALEDALQRAAIRVQTYEMKLDVAQNRAAYTLKLKYSGSRSAEQVLKSLTQLSGVASLQWQ
jgi:putative Mg2+ transporter-C (MgtC) family protein